MTDHKTPSETASNDSKNHQDTESLSYEELMAYLNAETGKITWQELQPHFAQGALLHLEAGYDLIDTAAALVRDDKSIVLPMIENAVLGKITDDDAKAYTPEDSFWAVVVAPWVLIQPINIDA